MKTTSIRSNDLLTDSLSEPLNGVTAAKVDINSESGNLTIDPLTSGEQVLASGQLQYSEKQGPPIRTLDSDNGFANFALRGAVSGRPWFRFPWAACNGALEWQIYLNLTVSFDIIAHSGGGNLKLNLSGLTVTRVSADTGGGNVEVVLPDTPADLNIAAKSGAGNVDIHLPGGIEARVQALSGLGKVIMDSRFNRTDSNTYQTPGYDGAAHKVEIIAKTGAGNVTIHTRASD